MKVKKRYKKNLNKYLQIPKFKITKETKDLVNEIVKDSNTDYEKAVAIENYLRKKILNTIQMWKFLLKIGSL